MRSKKIREYCLFLFKYNDYNMNIYNMNNNNLNKNVNKIPIVSYSNVNEDISLIYRENKNKSGIYLTPKGYE